MGLENGDENSNFDYDDLMELLRIVIFVVLVIYLIKSGSTDHDTISDNG